MVVPVSRKMSIEGFPVLFAVGHKIPWYATQFPPIKLKSLSEAEVDGAKV